MRMASPAPRGVAAALVAVLVALALASTVAAQAASQRLVLSRQEHHESLLQARANPLAAFTEWATRHAKEYLNDAAALQHRFSVWLDNLEYAIAYNSDAKTKGRSHWLGMNHLADLTLDEYRARYTSGFDNAARLAANGAKKPTGFMYANVSDDDLPLHIDWRQLGAVSEVKNQAQCGSCWAFSTTGSVEGINAIFSKQLLSLSEQELVDCDTKEDKGCRGGLMDYAYEWIIENKGITTEQDYPYTAEDGECVARKKHHRYVTIDGYEDIPPNDEAALKKAVAHQPVSVAIEADQKSFQLYVGGVFDDAECGTALDHGVLVTGYGHDATGGWYWDVKNSWGDQWGEQGYIRIAMGAAVKEGLCGIAMAASYPTKTSPNPPAPGPDPPEPEPGPGPAPGPAPGPVDCDDSSQCPAGTTCCCVSEAFNMCFQWGCCPMENAVCCSDHQHCCPSTLPVCDTKGGRCLPGSGSELGAVPWSAKLPATTVKAGGAAARSRVAASRKAAVSIAAQKK